MTHRQFAFFCNLTKPDVIGQIVAQKFCRLPFLPRSKAAAYHFRKLWQSRILLQKVGAQKKTEVVEQYRWKLAPTFKHWQHKLCKLGEERIPFRQYTPKSTHGLNPDALGNVVQTRARNMVMDIVEWSCHQANWIRFTVRDASRERGKKGDLAKFSFRPESVVATRNRIERKRDNEGSLAIKLHGAVQHP